MFDDAIDSAKGFFEPAIIGGASALKSLGSAASGAIDTIFNPPERELPLGLVPPEHFGGPADVEQELPTGLVMPEQFGGPREEPPTGLLDPYAMMNAYGHFSD